MDQLYVLAGEPFSYDEVVAGRRRFKRLRKFGQRLRKGFKKIGKIAAPILSVASFAVPALAPAAAAATAANKLAARAKRGDRKARAAMRMLGTAAARGDGPSQNVLHMMGRKSHLTPASFRQLAALARRGNPQARRILRYVAGRADVGDEACQRLLAEAAGMQHNPHHHPYVTGADVIDPPNPTYLDVAAGGPLWDAVKPIRGYRPEAQVFGPRDAYYDGLHAVPARSH